MAKVASRDIKLVNMSGFPVTSSKYQLKLSIRDKSHPAEFARWLCENYYRLAPPMADAQIATGPLDGQAEIHRCDILCLERLDIPILVQARCIPYVCFIAIFGIRREGFEDNLKFYLNPVQYSPLKFRFRLRGQARGKQNAESACRTNGFAHVQITIEYYIVFRNLGRTSCNNLAGRCRPVNLTRRENCSH